jgi:hypothetical protein
MNTKPDIIISRDRLHPASVVTLRKKAKYEFGSYCIEIPGMALRARSMELRSEINCVRNMP